MRDFASGNVGRMENHHFVFKGAETSSVSDLGGKGFNLNKLAAAGFNVPKFFIVTTCAFDYFLTANGIKSSVTKDSIMDGVFPEDLDKEIAQNYTDTLGGMAVAVRSSATNEDAKNESLAGKYRTVLSVSGDGLTGAIKEVYSSLFVSQHNESDKMAVIVQQQIEPQKAGVIFADNEKIAISSILGQGELFVSGRERGDTYLVEKGNIVARNIKLQSSMSVDGVNYNTMPSVAGAKQKLNDYEILKLSDLAEKVLAFFEEPQDIEWCIRGDDVFLLQSRPVTKPFDIKMVGEKSGYLPISRGTGTGEVWLDPQKIPDRDIILVSGYVDQKDLEALIDTGHLKGIITESGGSLSHEGILAREKGIPYLAGFASPQKTFVKGKTLSIDTINMSVKMDGTEMINPEAESYIWLDRDIFGLKVIRPKKWPAGLVVRCTGEFIIVYGTQLSQKLRDEVIGVLNSANKTVLANPEDHALESLHKIALNVMFSGPIKQHTETMASEVGKFDHAAFSKEYAKAKELIKSQFANTLDLYATYMENKTVDNLKQAFESLIKSNGYYKSVCIMSDYFDYALGSFISRQEGHTVTDIEFYKLKEAYEGRYPDIPKTAALIGEKISELNRTLPAFGRSSLSELFDNIVSEAKGLLDEDTFTAIMLSTEE